MVLLEEVRRRNRQWMVVLAFVAAVNYWVVCSLAAGFFGWGLVLRIDENVDVPVWLVLVTSWAAGGLIAFVYVGARLRAFGQRTVRHVGAVEIVPGTARRLENILEGLAIAAGAPPVRAALLDDAAPNALAVGRSPERTTVVVTTGLVELLARDELEAVLAVELCAVDRLDVALRTTVVACAGGAIGIHRLFLEDGKDPRLWPAIAATWPTMVVAAHIGRWATASGRFDADAMAVGLTRHPKALMRALAKLRDDSRVVRSFDRRTAPLWFEPMPDDGDDLVSDATPTLQARIIRLQRVSAGPPPP